MRPLVGNGFQFRRTDGNWVLVWLFFRPRVRGSQGTSPFEFRHYRQTRFGYARSKRSQPQFKAHNSVRPFENGLRSLGSSATRPGGRGRGTVSFTALAKLLALAFLRELVRSLECCDVGRARLLVSQTLNIQVADRQSMRRVGSMQVAAKSTYCMI